MDIASNLTSDPGSEIGDPLPTTTPWLSQLDRIEAKLDQMLLYASQTKNIADMVMSAMSGLEDHPMFKLLGMGKKDKKKNPIDVG